MYRARRWTVVVLVVVTGVVVGFARLNDPTASAPPAPPVVVEPRDDAAETARCFEEMVQHLERQQDGCAVGKPIPPLGELPPLPPELLPPNEGADALAAPTDADDPV